MTNITLDPVHSHSHRLANLYEFSLEYNGHLDVTLTPRDFNPDCTKWFDVYDAGVKVGHLRSILWGNGANYRVSQALNLWVAADLFVIPQFRHRGVCKATISALMQMGSCDMIYIERNIEKVVTEYKSLGFRYAFPAAYGLFLITNRAQELIGSCPELAALPIETMIGESC